MQRCCHHRIKDLFTVTLFLCFNPMARRFWVKTLTLNSCSSYTQVSNGKKILLRFFRWQRHTLSVNVPPGNCRHIGLQHYFNSKLNRENTFWVISLSELYKSGLLSSWSLTDLGSLFWLCIEHDGNIPWVQTDPTPQGILVRQYLPDTEREKKVWWSLTLRKQ